MNWSRIGPVLGLYRHATINLGSGAASYDGGWQKVRGALILGAILVVIGWLIYSSSNYWGGTLSSLGATLIGLGVYWRFEHAP